jgi:PAS domain S-box-containing protein
LPGVPRVDTAVIGRRADKDFAASVATARFAAAAILVAVAVTALASMWLFGPIADRATMARWGMVLAGAAAVVAIAFLLLVAASRRFRVANTAELADLRDVLESMADGLLLWDHERRLAAWNERLFEFLPHLRGLLEGGMDAHRLAWRSVRAAHPGWDAARQSAWVAQRMLQIEAGESVLQLVLADGRQLEVTQRPTAAGGVVLLYRDITERERALRAIAASEARFRDAISSMGEGIALWDRDGRLVLWNERYLEILPNVAPHVRVGITLAELNTLSARTAFPHWSGAEVAALVARRMTSRREPGVPFELRFDDGRIVEIVDHRTSEGGHVSIFRDVTAARRAAAELAASEARFRDGISSMADGFVMWDRDGKLVAWNDRVAELMPHATPYLRLGVDRAQTVRDAAQHVKPDWTPEERTAWIADRLAGFGDPARKPSEIRFDDGRTIEIIDRKTADGGCVSIYRDVTAREQQAAALARALQIEREANQQQRRFIAVASHEFRTPLAIIDGAAQRLLARLSGADEEIVRRLHRIRSATARMTGLTEVTLSSARLESGQLQLKPSRFDVLGMLRELCERQRGVTPDFAIELAGQEPIEVEADAQLIEQALGNLLTNAVKYSGSSRRVAISVRAVEDGVEIAVRDFGVGIPSGELPQLFTRFFRATTSRLVSGTGIGLHFAREILQLHDGSISVESEIGTGSTFTVHLPTFFSAAPRAAPD